MFRLPEDGAVINRYGFNSEGHNEVLKRLRMRLQLFTYTRSRRRPCNASPADPHPMNKSLRDGKLLGVNLGKNKTSPEENVEDYVKGVEKFGPYADYLVVNISSPNTPGLRGLQKKEALQSLVKQVASRGVYLQCGGTRRLDARSVLLVRARVLRPQVVATRNKIDERPPLLVKIAPDLSDAEITDIATVAAECEIDGIIVSNTTTSRPTSLRSREWCCAAVRRQLPFRFVIVIFF
ncbi:MAG: Dihydroorotate dehydrogenase [Olpidium bornovanus]|uniref:Dihydroorotate dehydrogenase n=1 Tax=Olpidium bornovanus TaxID=278681 RepID=A0A8H7ZY33_9FUNG|nr:MAG: Dihydroorotate dehydrogenase [Olpidium bornovanus]